MFERWSEEAKRALTLAETLAQEAGQHYVGPEHLLVGIIDVDDAEVDAALHQQSAQVRLAALAALKRRKKAVDGPLPVVASVARVFGVADKESVRTHEPVRPVVLLKALLAAHERAVDRALRQAGIGTAEDEAFESGPVPEDLVIAATLADLQQVVAELRDEVVLLRAEIAELRRQP